MNKKTEPVRKAIPESEWPWPTAGGTYRRDAVTGALTRPDAPEPAAQEKSDGAQIPA